MTSPCPGIHAKLCRAGAALPEWVVRRPGSGNRRTRGQLRSPATARRGGRSSSSQQMRSSRLNQLGRPGQTPERYRIQAKAGRGDPYHRPDCPLGPDPFLTFFGAYRIRSWTPSDAHAVARLAESVQSLPGPDGTTFNPEGTVEDCFQAQAEYFDQGGAFVVVERHESEDVALEVVGSTAVVLGDELAYFQSGASMSYLRRPISAALRRVCLSDAVPTAEAVELLKFLVQLAEGIALYLSDGSPVSLIALGVDRTAGDLDSSAAGRGLGRDCLEQLGYSSLGRLSYNSGVVSIEELGRVIDISDRDTGGTSSREAGDKGSSELIEVTTNGKIQVGTFTRAFVEGHNLLHSAVGCLVMNTRGEIYVHKRSPTKSVHPSMYDMYVGGLVTAGESPGSAARQELLEELGLEVSADGAGLMPTFVKPFLGQRNRVLVHCYRFVVNDEQSISYNDGEIVAGMWMAAADIETMRASKEFVPGGLSMWEETMSRGIV